MSRTFFVIEDDLQSQLDSVPIELVQLISFLQDGIDLKDKGYMKEALAISQTITYNVRCSMKYKGISSYKQYSKNNKLPSLLYVSVKLYSSSLSKTLVNCLYFYTGISIPYKILLELTIDIANQVISQYNRSGTILPGTLRKSIMT